MYVPTCNDAMNEDLDLQHDLHANSFGLVKNTSL